MGSLILSGVNEELWSEYQNKCSHASDFLDVLTNERYKWGYRYKALHLLLTDSRFLKPEVAWVLARYFDNITQFPTPEEMQLLLYTSAIVSEQTPLVKQLPEDEKRLASMAYNCYILSLISKVGDNDKLIEKYALYLPVTYRPDEDKPICHQWNPFYLLLIDPELPQHYKEFADNKIQEVIVKADNCFWYLYIVSEAFALSYTPYGVDLLKKQLLAVIEGQRYGFAMAEVFINPKGMHRALKLLWKSGESKEERDICIAILNIILDFPLLMPQLELDDETIEFIIWIWVVVSYFSDELTVLIRELALRASYEKQEKLLKRSKLDSLKFQMMED